jgi:hypothetical protein
VQTKVLSLVTCQNEWNILKRIENSAVFAHDLIYSKWTASLVFPPLIPVTCNKGWMYTLLTDTCRMKYTQGVRLLVSNVYNINSQMCESTYHYIHLVCTSILDKLLSGGMCCSTLKLMHKCKDVYTLESKKCFLTLIGSEIMIYFKEDQHTTCRYQIMMDSGGYVHINNSKLIFFQIFSLLMTMQF